jgi:hypothetical protein
MVIAATMDQDGILKINGIRTFPQFFYWECGYDGFIGQTCIDNLIANSVYTADIAMYAGVGTSGAHETAGKGYLIDITAPRPSVHNCLLGYALPDEPIATGQNLSDLKSKYNAAKAEGKIVYCADYGIDSPTKMKGITDIDAFDCYAFRHDYISKVGRNNALYYNEYLMVDYTYFLKPAALEPGNSGPSIWRCIQAIGTGQDAAGVVPITASELRGIVYQTITQNMKGIAYFSYTLTAPEGSAHKGLFTNPALAQVYRNQAAEINSLNDILVLPTIDYCWQYRQGTKVSFSNQLSGWSGHRNFNYMLKQDGATTYLIVLNKDTRSVTTDITIQGLSGTMTAVTLGNSNAGATPGRSLPVMNGKFTDTFGSLAANVYKISGTITPPTTGSIGGLISDISGQIMSSVTVSDGTRNTITDSNGKYIIPNIPAGNYVVQASQTGYVTNSKAVTVITGQTATANIILTPVAPPDALRIVDSVPTGVVISDILIDNNGITRVFTLTVNQPATFAWFIDGVQVQSINSAVTTSSLSHSSLNPETQIIRVVATNANGTVSREWTWIVTVAPSPIIIPQNVKDAFNVINTAFTVINNWIQSL